MNIVIIGATSEIAKEVGRVYSTNKNNLLLIGRNAEKLDNIKSDFINRGATSAQIFTANLDDPHCYEGIVTKCTSTFKQLDILLIAHGSLPVQAEIENNCRDLETYAKTNYFSYISLLTAFAKTFEVQKTGSIAVFSSVAGDRGRRSNYIYGSFKAGIQAFLEGYAARMSRSNVHVLDIRPGMVDTPMTANLKKGPLFSKPAKIAKDIEKAISSKQKVLYTPFHWKFIMLIIKNIPRSIFYRLNF